ncbi:hypothetical protein Sru01_08920 [Sphaerisporangium rufum]|uniref:ATP synthase F0 subunit B n=1 Tax=Sphaerisporangium rufum TaxID=1381558 RepID=A0A919R001_9ACTN|nr:hypothetical protein [Sphaerisporangium rufum]GII75910.1 hypothetical protein Sru01_08920 [Sphaerisporangium rufum]
MVGLHDFLGRFRRVAVPGGAAPAGVPADPEAERAAELAPVFAALADAHGRCARIRADAEREAGELVERARARAASVVAAARTEAAAERARLAARAREDRGREGAAAAEAARREVAAVRKRAGRRMPGEVARVVGMIRALADA